MRLKRQTVQKACCCGLAVIALVALPRRAWLQKEAPAAKNSSRVAPQVRPSLKEEVQGGHSANGNALRVSNASMEGTEESACPICPVTDAGEIQVLLALRERRLVLNAREHQLAGREAAVERLSRELDRRVVQLESHLVQLEAKLNVGEAARARREAQLVALVESLSTMPAKKSAPLLAETDPEVAAEVLRRLGPARTASLLTAMPVAKAGRLMSLGIHPTRSAAKATQLPASSAPSAPAAGAPSTAPGGP